MSNSYSPAKFYICAARGNGKSLITSLVCEAINRADVYQRFDFWTCTVYFYSNNQKEPLTDKEKHLIRYLLTSRMPSLKVVFEDGKYPLDISEDEPANTDWCKPMEVLE